MSAERAEVFGPMSAILTLDELAELNERDEHGRRFEQSPEGTLTVMPPPGLEHAKLTTRLIVWFVKNGWPEDQILPTVGLKIRTRKGTGGRIPDLTVWSTMPKGRVWPPTDQLLVVIEIISPGSEATDRLIKKAEYADAGIQRYWIIDQDQANTVTMLRLESGGYQEIAVQPLAWLLTTDPADHLKD